MKRYFRKRLLLIGATALLIACSSKGGKQTETAIIDVEKECVEVIYFHGKQRCITCNAIESLTKEVVEEAFAEQLASGKLILRTIDISSKEGEQIADSYEVTWSSLYINRWIQGEEQRNNMTEFGFSYAKNSPHQFKAGVKAKVEELLIQ